MDFIEAEFRDIVLAALAEGFDPDYLKSIVSEEDHHTRGDDD